VAGGILSKLPESWGKFATSLRHKRQTFSVAGLIGILDVEEKARAKDKRVEESSTANLVQQKKHSNDPHNKKKKNQKPDNSQKAKKTTTFKKNKKKWNCFVCGDPGHLTSECKDKWTKDKKTANMVIGEGTSGYGNLLPTVLSVCHSPDWWVDTGANIHVCSDISMFSSYQDQGAGALLMGNGSHAAVQIGRAHV
jgi:hypothetical protein